MLLKTIGFPRKIKKTYSKVPISPSFILFFVWFVINNSLLSFFTFLFVVLLHEFGHYFVAKKLGYTLNSFFIAPYGVNLNYKESCFENLDEIFIAMAGPMINIALCIVLTSFWWVCPSFYNFSVDIVKQSLLLALFNLLPCYPLDGGRIVASLLSLQIPRKKAINVTIKLNVFFAIIFLILFVISCFINFNPTFMLSFIFLILGIVENKDISYYQQIMMAKKTIKNFSKPSFIYIDEDVKLLELIKHIELNKFTIFILNKNGKTKYISETDVKKLSLAFNSQTRIKDILKQEKG